MASAFSRSIRFKPADIWTASFIVFLSLTANRRVDG
jgi:hypothetical protein